MLMMVMTSSEISLSSDVDFSDMNKNVFFKPVIEKLLKAGVDSEFVHKIIDDPSTEFNERFVRINVTGYLKPTDYSSHYNDKSVEKTKDFLNSNYGLLEHAEMRYGVPKEVISSVLWVETRHGSFLGNSHVASVYLSTAMCNETIYLDMNIQNLRDKFSGNEDEFKLLEKKIYDRAKKKSDWAIEQLIALEKIDKKSGLSALDIKGSWAGAFGISQFIPSSYLSWAVDGDNDGKIDLFNLNDAIFSVANYLKSNGWGEEDSLQRAAVFHYNNSNAYVDAVLKLASLVKTDSTTTSPKSNAPAEVIMQAQSGGNGY
jgi:membrane-bound lytic murein transglycosylase B